MHTIAAVAVYCIVPNQKNEVASRWRLNVGYRCTYVGTRKNSTYDTYLNNIPSKFKVLEMKLFEETEEKKSLSYIDTNVLSSYYMQ